MTRFTLNGKARRISPHPMKRLLDALREDCGLTGTKEGCGEGECGACTVLIDGSPVNSCLVPVAHVEGCGVQTIEGLGGRHPLQSAFVEHGGAQCGICTPGMIMAAAALGPKPSLREVQTGLAGNLCRCTGYSAIYRSIAKQTAPAAMRPRPSTTAQVVPSEVEGRGAPAFAKASARRAVARQIRASGGGKQRARMHRKVGKGRRGNY